MRRYVLAAVFFAGLSAAALASEVARIDLPGKVTGAGVAGGSLYAATTAGAFRIDTCGGDPCAVPVASLPRAVAPAGGLPDGGLATSAAGDIRRAWYSRPTGRYDHGALADTTEAGGIVAETADGKAYEYVLPPTHVFEDLTPRIADLDGDGRNELVVIRSSLSRGSAVGIFGLRGGKLALLAASPEIGRTHRWLNIAGIGEFLGHGRKVVAWVETPHIGGTLKMAEFAGGKLVPVAANLGGFSNHVIHTRDLGLSAVGDFDGDGIDDLALPSADRRALVIVGVRGLKKLKLPARAVFIVASVGRKLVTATDDGGLLSIVP